MNDDTIIPQQDEVLMYANQSGGITIERVDPMGNNECVVTVPLASVPAFVKRMREIAASIKRGEA